jgi:AraC-like DNA-binding protein
MDGAIRYLEHGYPNPLVRWHYHEEYELHLIIASKGKAFVGDYIGQFYAGHLVLTGPRLPHNWISYLQQGESYDLRDMVLQFKHETIANAAKNFQELEQLLPLMESAKHGIEFFGMGNIAENYMSQIRDSYGIYRLTRFLLFMQELEECRNRRQLSTLQVESNLDKAGQDKISTIVDFITENYQSEISLRYVAEMAGMSTSHFSRFFRKATGNTFKDFFTGVRISKACELLSNSDKQITNICYAVGYNNISNFNRRFLERKKVSPREYRRQAKARLTRGGETTT